MATGTVVPLTLEQKIEQAAGEAGQIASIFSPAVGAAIQAGVAAEPIIYGMIHMFLGLFKHHVSGTVAPPGLSLNK